MAYVKKKTEEKKKPGRKPKYTDPKELAKKIDEYFEECKGEVLLNNEGNPVLYKGVPVYTDRKVPSVAGLALACGFTYRQSLDWYLRDATEEDKENPESFYSIIKAAKLRIEVANVDASMNRESFQGARIQLLSNYGYSDKPTVEVNVTNNTTKITNEQAEAALAALGYKKEAQKKK